jgi:hypothetical protein
MFRKADVCYFKTAKNGSHRKANSATFKGHGFGMFLGHVPPFGKDPTPQELIMLVGSCGWLTFDDVAEFLGDEAGKHCVAAYEAKYYGKQEPAVNDDEGKKIIQAPPRRQLLDSAGKPFMKKPMKSDDPPVPVLTLADVQAKIKAMSPEQIRAALDGAKINATGPMTPEQEKEALGKACEILGVDPAKVADSPPIENGKLRSVKDFLPKGDEET